MQCFDKQVSGDFYLVTVIITNFTVDIVKTVQLLTFLKVFLFMLYCALC